MHGTDLQPVRSSMRPTTWIRLIISAGLIAWIMYSLDWAEVRAVVRDTDMYYLALSVMITPLLILTGVFKWWILLRARGIPVQSFTCFAVYLIGTFFNNFLPTNFGGDAVRAYIMGRTTGRYAMVSASVFIERFLGFTIFILMIPLAYLLSPAELWNTAVQVSVAVVMSGYLLVLWIVLDARFHRLLSKGSRIPPLSKLLRFQEAVIAYKGHSRALIACLAISTAFYFLAVCNIYVSLLAFNVELPFVSVFVVTAVVLVISMLPIAINGVGLAEWAYIFALTQFGASPEVAISVALLIRLKTLAWSLLGGAIHGSGYQPTIPMMASLTPPAAVRKGDVCD